MKYTEFIWDFDGTLFNTYTVMVKAFQEALRGFGIIENHDILFGRMKVAVDATIHFYQDRFQLGDELLERYLVVCRSYSEEEQPPLPGAREVCRQIVGQGGRNFIISHRESVSLFTLLDYYGMRQSFTEIVTSRYGFERKPDPEAFHYLLKKYRLQKEKSLTIGDRTIDILAGRASGIKTAFILSDVDSQCDHADYQIHSLEEILDL